MAKLIPIVSGVDNSLIGYRFYCPACEELHPFYVAGAGPLWNFNGNLESPSFSPSLRMIGGKECHLYVSSGLIQYCQDSKHALAGKIVPMVDWDVENWKPQAASLQEKTMDTLHTVNGQPVKDAGPAPAGVTTPAASPVVPAAAPVQPGVRKHKPECGEVGETGEHGDLGSNAA